MEGPNMAKSARRKGVNPDWLDAELKALPDLDIGFDLDLPGLDFDPAELDALLGLGDELPDLGLGFDLEALDKEPSNCFLRHPKDVRRVMGNEDEGTVKSKRACGAKTRTGKPCQAPGNGSGGRCKLHGGKSTGPKTQDGKARSLAALRRGV
jgi:hypothetical protein